MVDEFVMEVKEEEGEEVARDKVYTFTDYKTVTSKDKGDVQVVSVIKDLTKKQLEAQKVNLVEQLTNVQSEIVKVQAKIDSIDASDV